MTRHQVAHDQSARGQAARDRGSREQADCDQAEAGFVARFPGFDPDGAHRRLRREEYGRLDRAGQVYLDYTGGSLYAARTAPSTTSASRP